MLKRVAFVSHFERTPIGAEDFFIDWKAQTIGDGRVEVRWIAVFFFNSLAVFIGAANYLASTDSCASEERTKATGMMIASCVRVDFGNLAGAIHLFCGNSQSN